MKLGAHPVFPTKIIIGPRVIHPTNPVPADPAGGPLDPLQSAIQTALVVVVKGTFTADDPNATPRADQEDLLDGDVTSGDAVLAESDLAIFKPRTDVIVQGAPAAPPPPEPGATLVDATWDESVTIGAQSMSDEFPNAVTPAGMTFAWEPRLVDPDDPPAPADPDHSERPGYSGDYGDPPAFDPEDRLPVGFTNLFANGGDYQGGDRPVFTHPAAGSEVVVATSGEFDVAAVPHETVTESTTLHLPAAYPAATVRYRDAIGRPLQSPVPLQADTIVFDKATGVFTVTWRGTFDYESVPADRYDAVEITGGA